jgi:hypothetical protein
MDGGPDLSRHRLGFSHNRHHVCEVYVLGAIGCRLNGGRGERRRWFRMDHRRLGCRGIRSCRLSLQCCVRYLVTFGPWALGHAIVRCDAFEAEVVLGLVLHR